MQAIQVRRVGATGREAATAAVLGPSLALTEARSEGVRLFERRPPLHSVLIGACRVEVGGSLLGPSPALALPAGALHRVVAVEGPSACVAYLDARRYRFDDVRRLAERWRGFVPGQDDLREAFGDALALPLRRLDRRLVRALDSLETEGATVESAARLVGLSPGRLAHLTTETLGPSPVEFRSWFKLRRALRETLLGGANLTTAAHAAGFSDSAHLTRTCKRLTGVAPAGMLPPTIYLANDP